MSDQIGEWWSRIVAARLAGDREADLDFVRGVVKYLDDLAPKAMPARPHGVPAAGELESLARDGARGGDWLPRFLDWREQVLRVEATNAASLETVYGAAMAAARLGEASWLARCTAFCAEVYRHRGPFPVSLLEARRAAKRLTTRLDVLPVAVREAQWEPSVVVSGSRTSPGMGARRDAAA